MKFFLVLILFNNLFAHGENQLGPHQGFIQMPGNYHIEVVPQDNLGFKVYLQDVNNKNPTTKKSSVKLAILNNGKYLNYNCTQGVDYFNCIPNQLIKSIEGELVINSTRLDQKGQKAIFKLPLRLNLK